jgi:hypothetical protein
MMRLPDVLLAGNAAAIVDAAASFVAPTDWMKLTAPSATRGKARSVSATSPRSTEARS